MTQECGDYFPSSPSLYSLLDLCNYRPRRNARGNYRLTGTEILYTGFGCIRICRALMQCVCSRERAYSPPSTFCLFFFYCACFFATPKTVSPRESFGTRWLAARRSLKSISPRVQNARVYGRAPSFFFLLSFSVRSAPSNCDLSRG